MAKASQFLQLMDAKRQAVKGESFSHDHQDWIDLTGWSWGVEDPAARPKSPASQAAGATQASSGRMAPGRGGGSDSRTPTAATAGRGEGADEIKPALFAISKYIDLSTARLLSAMDKGEIFPSAKLTIKEEFSAEEGVVGRKPFELNITFSKVFFVKLDLSFRAGNAGIETEETWEFNYEKVTFEYDYRGKEGHGIIPAQFVRKGDSSDGAATRSPPSASESRAARDREMEEWARRSGWTPPGKRK